MDENNKCNLCKLNKLINVHNSSSTLVIQTTLFKFSKSICNPFVHYNLDFLCDIYLIGKNKYIKKCCYNNIIAHLRQEIFNTIFVLTSLDFADYVRIIDFNSFEQVDINRSKINYLGNEIKFSVKKLEFYENEKIEFDNKLQNKDSIIFGLENKINNINKELNDEVQIKKHIITNLQNKINKLEEELNKKDMLNKRLIDTLMLYRYKEFNNTITYDYNEIKQKNKALNTEFKRVAKLMKLS